VNEALSCPFPRWVRPMGLRSEEGRTGCGAGEGGEDAVWSASRLSVVGCRSSDRMSLVGPRGLDIHGKPRNLARSWVLRGGRGCGCGLQRRQVVAGKHTGGKQKGRLRIVSSDRLFLYCLINHTGSISGVICCISCMDVMRTMAEQSSAEQCGTGARRDVRGRGRGRGARREASSKASVASDNAKLERPGSGRASIWRARSVQRAGRVASRVHAMLVGSPHMGGRIVLPLLATPDASPLDADRICDGQPDLVEVTPCGKRGNASS
jgi:hypothetical protein